MKITDVELYSNNINFINFGVRKVSPSARFMIRDITGLDAEEIIPMFYGTGLETYGKFYDYGMKPREIVMKIALNPRFNLGEDYADVRDELYRAISSSRFGQIIVHFNADGTNVGKTTAQITKFETTHFAQLPEVQLTLRCDDPFFQSIDPVKYDIEDLNPSNVGGPLANPIIISDGLSTAPHGFQMEITFLASSAGLTIQDKSIDYEWKFSIYPSAGFTNGCKLYFSSDRINKYLYMTQGAVTTYLMDRIDVSSIWPILFPGTNSFYIPEIASIRIDKVEFYANYWGV
jgi:hypothetical protein